MTDATKSTLKSAADLLREATQCLRDVRCVVDDGEHSVRCVQRRAAISAAVEAAHDKHCECAFVGPMSEMSLLEPCTFHEAREQVAFRRGAREAASTMHAPCCDCCWDAICGDELGEPKCGYPGHPNFVDGRCQELRNRYADPPADEKAHDGKSGHAAACWESECPICKPDEKGEKK